MSKNKINVIIITVTFALLAIILYGQSGNMLIDFSRESYIPYQMLQGKKLGTDIFLIYGPFGYFLNMLLYKIWANINIILIEALAIAYSVTILLYFIFKKFTTHNMALVFTIFFIIVSAFSNSNFSFVLPYSYSTLWAILALYLIFFSYLYKKTKLRYVLLGFIAINKIELFILALVFFIAYDFYYKKFDFKNYLFVLIIPAICFIITGFSYIDSNNMLYLKKMLSTDAIHNLYKGMGSFFEIKYFLFNLINLLLYIGASAVSYLIYKHNKIISVVFLAIAFLFFNNDIILNLGFFAAVILSIINFNKLKNRDYLLLFFSFILCSKAIFAINPLTYSNFGYCLMVFYIFRQLSLILDKSWVVKHFLILIIFLIARQGIYCSYFHKMTLNSDFGRIKLFKSDYTLISDINNYIKKNVKTNETMIVVPEGQIINLINNKNWDFYNSTFTPQDLETFSEDNIINQLKSYKTNYVIIYPRDTADYGAKAICEDYGVDFCKFIMDNYTRVATFGNMRKAFIYKINEK